MCVCALPLPTAQTMPFPVVTNNLKVQMAVQTPSTWSKLFSFSKSHATILKLEGQVSAMGYGYQLRQSGLAATEASRELMIKASCVFDWLTM